MVYKRKRKFRKKRFGRRKRKRGRNRFFKNYVKIQKAMLGSRTFMTEDRSVAVTSPTNEVLFSAVFSMADMPKVQAMVESTLGVSGNALGHGVQELDPSTALNQRHLTFDIKKHKSIVHFRNVSEHAAFLTVYECVAKQSYPFDAVDTNAQSKLMNDLANGWKDDMGAGASTATTKSGDLTVTFAASSASATCFSQYIKPQQSRQFNLQWKIVKQKKFKMNTGDDVFWKMYVRDRVWNPYKEKNPNSGTFNRDVVKGYTKVLLVRLCGAMGRNIVAGQHGTIGLMNVDLTLDTLRRAQVVPVTQGFNDHSSAITHDNLAGVTLGAGSRFVLTDDVD